MSADNDSARLKPVHFVLFVLGVAAYGIWFTYGAVTRGEEWRHDTIQAVWAWYFVGVLVIDRLYLYRLRKVTRHIVSATWVLGLGVLLLEVDAVVHAGEKALPLLLVLAGAVGIGQGILSRRLDKKPIPGNTSNPEGEFQSE